MCEPTSGGSSASSVSPTRHNGRGQRLESIAIVTEMLGDLLDGYRLLGNNSKWLSFPTVRVERWYDGNVALLGDAAHTAHFSIGSATKLAVEDATTLVTVSPRRGVHRSGTGRSAEAPAARREHAARRSSERAVVRGSSSSTSTRTSGSSSSTSSRAAAASPTTTSACATSASSTASTSGSRRCPDPPQPRSSPSLASADVHAVPASASSSDEPRRRVAHGRHQLDGYVEDFHLVHLGARALGGAGLVMSEMLCVSPTGRITPGCAGLWEAGQVAAWRRIVDFVHANSESRIWVQLGHSGARAPPS